jgi:hypothetical protein
MRKAFISGLIGLLPLAAMAQQMDMDAMAKWGAADVVRYHIVGVFQGVTYVAGDGSGQADITDRVVIDLTWKLSEEKLVGTPTFQNSKSTASKLRDRESVCLAPVLKGDFEFFELLEVRNGLGGGLHLVSRTSRPVVEVAQFCTASRRSVPAKVEEETEDFGVPSPVLFAMPLPKSDDLVVSPDRKSLIVKKDDGWTWTFTPSIAR